MYYDVRCHSLSDECPRGAPSCARRGSSFRILNFFPRRTFVERGLWSPSELQQRLCGVRDETHRPPAALRLPARN